MDSNIIKVQLASTSGLSMKIESQHKNTIPNEDFSFDQALASTSEKKVWDKELSSNFSLPVARYTSITDLGDLELIEKGKTLKNSTYPFQDIVDRASAQYGLPVSLINAVIKAESGFNPNVTSSAGAKGLMQLMDGTAKGLGVNNAYDPEQNINGGSKYLSMLLSKFDGELKVALAAYNAGPTRVERSGIRTNEDFEEHKLVLPKETQKYVEKVISYI